MNVIVCGSRSLRHLPRYVARVADELRSIGATGLISGACGDPDDFAYSAGGDGIGEMAAESVGIGFCRVRPEWARLGRAAGPKRNEQMAELAGACISLGGGAGTSSMIRAARFRGLRVVEINLEAA